MFPFPSLPLWEVAMNSMLLSLLFLVEPKALSDREQLSVEQIRIVRESVYEKLAPIGTDYKTLVRSVLVPADLRELYNKKPEAVLDVLEVIMQGGRPRDSVVAAAYAFELHGREGDGVVVVDFLESRGKEYDKLDRNWKLTPRDHWIERLRSKREEKKQANKDNKK